MPRNITPEQKQKAIERREKFRALVRQVAAMPDADRAAMIDRIGAVVTCEGRALSLTNTMLLSYAVSRGFNGGRVSTVDSPRSRRCQGSTRHKYLDSHRREEGQRRRRRDTFHYGDGL